MKVRNNKNRPRPDKKNSSLSALKNLLFIKRDIPILLFMIALTFSLYITTLNFPFHFDDQQTILDNHRIRINEFTLEQVSSVNKDVVGKRYITMISFALNYYFGGYNPFGYHLMNIIIHLVTGILIYYFIKTTLSVLMENELKFKHRIKNHNAEVLIPLFSSLIWLVHPLQTNSVTYIVQRMNSMAAMFYVLSMLLYVKGRIRLNSGRLSNEAGDRKHKSRHFTPYLFFAGCVLSGLLSLGCKENYITLPFFILLYELYFIQNLSSSGLKKFLIWIFVLSIMLFLVFQFYIGVQFLKDYLDLFYKAFPFTMHQRVLTEFRVVIYYVSLFFFPHPDRMNFDYDFPVSTSLFTPVTTLLSLFALLALAAVALFFARKERILSYGIFWYLGNLLIESSVIPLDIIFEHRTYLPFIFIGLITTEMICRFFGSNKLRIAFLSAIVAILSFWTIQRNNVWESPITLWQDCVKKSPGKDRPHASLGRAYMMEGRTDEAIIEYKKALAINPFHQFTLNNMGLAMYKKGDLDEAIRYYQKALQSDPDFAEAHNNLGVALIDQKKLEEGIGHYKKALRLAPKHPEAPGNLKKAVEGLQQINEKISEAQEKLKLSPDDFTIHYRLGFLFYMKGHFDTAIQHYQQALSIKSDHIKSLNGLSAIHSMRKQYDAALSFASQALELHPENPVAYYNIACIYSLQNDKKQAVAWLKKSVEKGFDKWELIRTDKDLMKIRDTEGYKNMIQNR